MHGSGTSSSDRSSVSDHLARVRRNIVAACTQYGRNIDDVNLLAVSKTVDIATINEVIAAGHRQFGENYLQEACTKIATTTHPGIVWHYIGAIQSNKTIDIAQNFSWVHTVSRTKIAERLSRQRPAHLPALKVMIQVNISNEASKAGIAPADTSDLVEAMIGLDRLEIRGLMAIPAPLADFSAQRDTYRRLKELKARIKARYGDDLPHFVDLSMGMSGDMEAAIAEGATWLRIGTAIFGSRRHTH